MPVDPYRPPWDIYNEEMSLLRFGHALWEPTPTKSEQVRPGDVGYIRDGRFHRLFPIDLAPAPLKRLDIGSTFSPDPLLPGHHTPSKRGTQVISTANVSEPSESPVPFLESDTSIRFEFSEPQGAALVTKYPIYREDVERSDVLKKHMKANYASWVELVRCEGFGDVNPILVTGVDKTKDYALMCYSNFPNGLPECTFKVATSSLGWGRWESQYSPHWKHGPQLHKPPSSPHHAGNYGGGTGLEGYHQCVFVRYFYALRRSSWRPMVIRAAAGPHDLGTGGNNDGGLSSEAQHNFGSGEEDEDETDFGPVLHNPTLGGWNQFSVLADFVFQNSDAEYVLLHHNDLALLHGPGETAESSLKVLEQLTITVDEDGVGTIVHPMGTACPKLFDPDSRRGASDGGPVISDETEVKSLFPDQVLGAVLSVLSSAKNEIISEDSGQLVDDCLNVSESLKCAMQGKNVSDLNHSEREAVVSLERVTLKIELALEGTKGEQQVGHNLEVGRHVLEVRRILGILQEWAWGRLSRHEFTPHEFPSLIEAIPRENEQVEMIASLPAGEANSFIEAIYEELRVSGLPSSTQKNALTLLRRLCGRHALVPEALDVLVRYEGVLILGPTLRIGSTEVRKGERDGRNVAVRITESWRDKKSFCEGAVMLSFLQHPCIVSLRGIIRWRLAVVTDWMPNGDITEYVKTHPDVDQIELLSQATEGLIYLHDNGIIHGNLKGAKVLIDETGHARLTGFDMVPTTSDSLGPSYYSVVGSRGERPWMSPELTSMDYFSWHPTRMSDCYALGMVIYETISGDIPFGKNEGQILSLKLRGEHPVRSAEFSEDLWEMLKSCWAFQPSDRPSIQNVLQRLRTVPVHTRGSAHEQVGSQLYGSRDRGGTDGREEEKEEPKSFRKGSRSGSTIRGELDRKTKASKIMVAAPVNTLEKQRVGAKRQEDGSEPLE